LSGNGNFTIEWNGTLSATSSGKNGAYSINAIGNIANSSYDWEVDSEGADPSLVGRIRDYGVKAMRGMGLDKGQPFVLEANRLLQGHFGGVFDLP
jgi:flagellar hook assembly protein FlgD